MKKIALISVSDKTDIDSFASQLVKNNYTIISTGGTAKYLEDKGITAYYTPINEGGSVVYRVRQGIYSNTKKAQSELTKITKLTKIEGKIITI